MNEIYKTSTVPNITQSYEIGFEAGKRLERMRILGLLQDRKSGLSMHMWRIFDSHDNWNNESGEAVKKIINEE